MSDERAHHLMPPGSRHRSRTGFRAALAADEAPAFASTALSQCAAIVALLAVLVLWLLLVGRPLLCPCGTVSLWVGDVHSSQSSQQVADWYSLLHIVFGFALFLFLDWMKPQWRTGQKLVLAVASSVAWEAVENLPVVIALFANAPGAPAYAGDSVLNAVADTVFVGAGFVAARFLPVPLVLALAVAFEIVVLHEAGDGYILGSLRLLGAAV